MFLNKIFLKNSENYVYKIFKIKVNLNIETKTNCKF